MGKKRIINKQVKNWIGTALLGLIGITSCTTETEAIQVTSSEVVALSSKSVEIPVHDFVSYTEHHKDSAIDFAFDHDRDTKWLAYGNEVYVDVDLNYIQKVDYVKVSFYEGDDKAFAFEVYALVDGVFSLIGSKTSSGTNTRLNTYDLTNAETNILRFKFTGNDEDLSNGVNGIQIWGTILDIEAEPESTKNAYITDTSDIDTGELRLDLTESIAVGSMSVTMRKGITQDGFLNLSGTSTTRRNAMIDMRLDDVNGYSFTESGATANTIANFPAFVSNTFIEVAITWDATAINGPLVSVSIDGEQVTDVPFTSESQDLAAILTGVKTIQFRLGGNGTFDATGAGMLVDNLKVYDWTSGVPVIIFQDDFEDYDIGYSLDPNATDVVPVLNSPYKDNSFQVTVQAPGEIMAPVQPELPTDGFGPASVAVGTVAWQNWYLSVPIDRADGTGQATSIYYQDIEALNLTDEQKYYFDQNADGSYKMTANFTGYTTSGEYGTFEGRYCRTELREYWQGNQSTADNWYMDEGIHELETTLSVERCEGEGIAYVAQIHGRSGISNITGEELATSPPTVKYSWVENQILLEYYTADGIIDGEWTSLSGTLGKPTLGEVGNNKFTLRVKVEAGVLYSALYCEATGVDTGYIANYDFATNGYGYANYFKTGNYFRHDEDYTSISDITLYSAVTNHSEAAQN